MSEDQAVDPEPSRGSDPRRLLRVLRRQSTHPEVMAAFFGDVGARGVVTTLASVAFGPLSESVLDLAELPGLVREGLQAAARWPNFDAEGFGAELAGLLRDATERDTVAAITSYLLTSGGYDPRLLAGWSSGFDDLEVPRPVPLTWGSFLSGDDGDRSWTGLAGVAASFGQQPSPGL